MKQRFERLSPAKVNLYLAVTGLRDDGFHSIDSLICRLDWGDRLSIEPSDRDSFTCNLETLLWDEDNLVFKALHCYRQWSGYDQPLKIDLDKQIPLGSGLGGGSSNASTLLQMLNELNPQPMEHKALAAASADIGSDCPLFFSETPFCRVRGRGEHIDAFSPQPGSWEGRSLLITHPCFPITAAWAYRQWKAGLHGPYTQPHTACQELEIWKNETSPWLKAHRNDLSAAVDRKYLAIPALKAGFQERFHLPMFMSGSGSTCFAILDGTSTPQVPDMENYIQSCWGNKTFIRHCLLLEN
jgi:4-diphosphocytidyl-2-C-methyl-D-erythritol kinase